MMYTRVMALTEEEMHFLEFKSTILGMLSI